MMSFIDEECKRGLYFNSVKSVVLKNVTMSGHQGEMVTALNVQEVTQE